MGHPVEELHQWHSGSLRYVEGVINVLNRADEAIGTRYWKYSDLVDEISRALALSVFETIPEVVASQMDRHAIIGEFAMLVLDVEIGGDPILTGLVKALRIEVSKQLKRKPEGTDFLTV